MIMVIVSKCGISLRRSIRPMDLLRQKFTRDALIGCGTNDDKGLYIDIAEVHFVERVSTDPLPV